MRISDSLVEKLLVDTDISGEQLTALKEQQQTDKKPLQDIVIKNSVMSEKEMDRPSYAYPSTARHALGQRIEESTLMGVPLRPLLCAAHY